MFMFKNKIMISAIISVVMILSSFILMIFSYGQPMVEEKTFTLCNYVAKGKYDYLAYLHPNIVYDNASTLGHGEGVLFLKLVKDIDVNYTFTFTVSKPAVTVVTYDFELKLVSPTGWEKSLLMVPKNEVESDSRVLFTANFTLNLKNIFSIIDQIESETGTSSSAYNLFLTANVHVLSSTDMGLIDLPFNHTLNVVFKYEVGGGHIAEITNLNYRKSGSITKKEILVHEDTKYRLYASFALLGIGVIGLASSTYFYFNNKKRMSRKSIKSVIKPLKNYLIEVKELPFKSRDVLSVEVRSIDDLAKIAEGLGKPVLLKKVNSKSAILRLIDGNVLYEHVIELEKLSENI